MIILRYNEDDLILLGNTFSNSGCTNFKITILTFLKRTMAREAEKEEYLVKGKILERNIKLEN